MMRTLLLPSRRARTSCSVLALATVLVVGASPAAAQSFLGVGTPTNGAATTITTGVGTTNISVTTSQTVINWVPTDNAIANNTGIAFQNSGTVATFSGPGNYAVLNRIVPTDTTRMISMNGTIQTSPPLGVPGSSSGSIYFYTPGGFVIGANAVINVGSLVLSTSDILVTGGSFINGPENTVIFGQATRPGAAIVTNALSQITANGTDAYVAMVAPRVQHGGTITVSGSAALVGAEAATINFSPDGLFDIQVTAGSTDANGVSVNGNIIGSASTGAGDARRAFLVAVPKNTALTLAIGNGADLGFAIAGAANVSGNAVILSAGHDIVNGEIGNVSAASGALANILANGLNATSGVRAAATNNAEFNTAAGQSSSFASDLDIRAPGQAWVSAFGAGMTMTIGRDLVLNSDRVATVAGGSATGGSAALYTGNNGSITVVRDATVTANATGASSSTAGIAGGTGTGGFAAIQNQAAGGTINIGGNALVSANGTGGNGLVAGANGGAGNGGGNALIRSYASGTSLTIGGTATAQARGFGGSALGCVGCVGGSALGGFAYASAEVSSTMSVAGMLRVNSDGIGGSGATGRGGTAEIFGGANSSLSAASLNASADGFGGDDAGAGAGNGFGGTARMRATGTGSSITITNVVTTGNQNQRDFISAEGFGGETNGGGSGIGGTGTGGTLTLSATAGGSITLPILASAAAPIIRARGYGGDSDTDGTTGGLGVGGTVNLSLDNGTLTAGPVQLSAVGLGGNSLGIGNINGGHGIGGTRNISAINGSTLSIGLAGGVAGGGGGKASGTGVGGNGSGGTASLLVDASTVNFTSRSGIIVQNAGGDGAIGGNASGGNATVTVRNGGIINVADDPTSTDDFVIGSFAYGGIGAGAQGGDATAGNVSLLLQGGTINLTGGMIVGAEARGGATLAGGGNNGDGNGGNVTVTATGANSMIAGSGAANFSADAFGGSSGSGIGGNGNAGSVTISAEGGTGLTIQNSLTVSASATGGNGATGGGAAAGNVIVRALTGGDLNLLGATSNFSANATGGNALGGGFGDGGDAYGWNIDIHADGVGSTLTIGGAATATANATSGSSESGDGGNADAGAIDLYAQNSGSLSFDSDLTALANAEGGTGPSGGGNAHGGEVSIYSLATLQVDGYLTARAEANGGDNLSADYSGWVAGDAYGGDVDVYANGANSTLTVANAVILSTNASGGAGANSGDGGGYGEGGNTHLYARADGTIDLQSSLTVSATGYGGDFGGLGTTGGDGKGGQIAIQADGANASVTVGGAELDASGYAVDGGGGSGSGGLVVVEAFGAPTASLVFLGNLAMYAGGGGGDGYYGSGGVGQGGDVRLTSTDGTVITVGGNAWLNTSASGGDTYNSASAGGNAVGGSTRIETFGTVGLGGTIAILGNADVTADGYGGGANGSPSGQGGDGTGGSAHILTTLGTITIGQDGPGGNVTVSADGYGGFAAGATGGDGFGGDFAVIEAIGGDITIYGSASVSTNGTGGYGAITGGDGLGSGEAFELGGGEGGAHIYARNGDIVIGGGALVSSFGTGGGGLNVGGDGGNGTGGWATIHAANSDLGPSSITIIGDAFEGSGYAEVNVNGMGGNGGNGASGNAGGDGGNGGIGRGGVGSITATAGNATVTILSADIRAQGDGGGGGNGGGGEGFDGGDGGNGGDGFGGYGTVGTQSGNGQSAAVNLGFGDFGSVTIDSSATGGDGGDGNFGSTYGDGGDGGNATGGAALLLVRGSRVDADMIWLNADADGGDGGLGDGETSPDGNGGNASVGAPGGIGVLVTDRYLIPAHRGTLNAGDISGSAVATGGDGATDGTSQNFGGSQVTFRDADGNIGSLDFVISASDQGVGAANESISIINGDVAVDGEFSFVTSGNLSLFANNGDMHAGVLTLGAGDFVFDAGPGNEPPTDRGTYFADSATITTGNNFVTSADLVIGSSLVIDAPGLINAHNFGIDGDLDLIAQSGGITANDLYVTGAANLDAFGAINLNIVEAGFFRGDAGGTFTSSNITSDSDIRIDAGDDVTLGDLLAGTSSIGSSKAVRIDTDGSVLVGNILAAGGIDVTADGSVTGGNVTSGDVLITEAGGAIDYQNISAGLFNPQIPSEPFSVVLDSSTSINVGTVDAKQGIGFVTLGTLTTGDLTTDSDILGLVHGNINIGDIDAGGRVQLADSAMFTNAGGAIGNQGDDEIDVESIFAAALVPTGGSITVGSVIAGSLRAAAGTSFTSGNIGAAGLIAITAGTSIGVGNITNTGNTNLLAGTLINVGAIDSGLGAVSLISGSSFISGDIVDAGSIFVDSGSDIFLGNLTAPGDIELVAVGDILIGNAIAGESIDLDAGGYVDGGNMTAGDSVYVGAGSYVDLLNISAGLIDHSTNEGADHNVGILAGTTILTGNIAAFNSIGLGAAGNIYTGSIDAGDIFLALGGGNMSFGTIHADGTTYLADDSMIPLGGDLSEEGGFDPALILAATPTPSGGSITLRGPVTAGKFVAAAVTTLTGTTIDSDDSIYAVSGGNMTLTDLDAGTTIYQRSDGAITENDINAGGYIDVRSAGGMTLGTLVAGDYVDLRAGGAIFTGNIEAAQYIGLATPGTITTGDIDAGGIFMALGHGNMSFGNATASEVYLADYAILTLGITASCLGTCGTSGADGVVTAPPTGSTYSYVTTEGGVAGAGQLPGEGGSNGSVYTTAGFSAAAGDDVNFWFNYVTSDGSGFADYAWAALYTTSLDPVAMLFTGRTQPSGTIVPGQDLPGVDATLSPSTVPIIDGAPVWSPLGTSSGTCFDAGCGYTGWVSSTYEIADAGTYVLRYGVTNWTDSSYQSGMAFSGITVAGVPVGSAPTPTGGSILIGNVNTGKFTAAAGTSLTTGIIDSGGSIELGAGGAITTSNLSAGDFVLANGGSIISGTIDAGSVQAVAGTTFTSGEINAKGGVELSSGGAMQLQDVTVGTSLRLTSGATIDGGNLTAGTLVRVSAVGAVDVGDIIIDGGILIDGFQAFDVGPGSPVEVFGASIITGDISTDGYVGLYTPGDLSVGTIDAGHDVIALVGDDAAFGAITTPERFFLGGYQMFALVTGGEGFNPEAVFDAVQKSATGGSATFAGSSSARSFEAYVGDDTTLASLSTDDFARIDTGGMFTLTGALNGDSRVISNDIDIGATASINGELHLISRNASQTLIGDGLDGLGQGYRLSDAEADRINAEFTIAADTSYGAAAKMIIGDLSIIADGDSESELEYGFGTINRDSDDPSVGSIKIVGDVTFSGLGQFDEVAFDTNLFELDAATGSITLYGQGTTLGGELGLYAPKIWVASGAILTKLEANPTYSGYITELNAPAAVQRPEGVLRAATFNIENDDQPVESFLVQNTGTRATPAGFVITDNDLGGDEGSDDPPGSINLVINGQIITAGGTLTSIAVRDLLVAGPVDTASTVAGSTINGCVLVGPCTSPPPPKIDTPVRTDVQLSDNGGLGDGLFGNEGDIDDGESGDGGDRSSPISPPMPLFDSRPLVQSGDVDDPVSGAGNPSLYGSPGDDEDEDEEEKKKKAKAKQGDGK